MGKHEKLLLKILQGGSDRNISFDELRKLLIKFGFDERVKGGHHILVKEGIEEIINIQSKSGMSKPYQVKQVRNIIIKYNLNSQEDEK